MARKPRIDSTAELVSIVSDLGKTLVCPAHIKLEDVDQPFFTSIIAEFTYSGWSTHQLEMAGMLARLMADMDREQMTLRQEGYVVKTAHGTSVVNPRKTVVQMLAGMILSFRRSLALHARASADHRDIARRRNKVRQIESDLEDALDNDLLARPN